MKTKLLIIVITLCTQLGFSQWTRIGSDIDGEAAFNYSANSNKHLAISGDGSIVAFSAPDNDTNGMKSGLLRVYKNTNNSWVQVGADLRGEKRDDYFGSSFGLSKNGDKLAVSGGGEIKIFNNTNNVWVESSNDIFDRDIKLFGNNIAINASGSVLVASVSNKNEIVVYYFTANGWVIGNVLSIADVGNAILKLNDTGNLLIIGNRHYNEDGTAGGRVMVYENLNGSWLQKGNSIIGTNNNQYFGSSVDISGDGSVITLGSPHTEVNNLVQAGFVRTYKFINNDWSQIGADLHGLAENINYGRSVSLNLDGSILAVGSDGTGKFGTSRGIAQIFKFENNDWTQIASTIVGEASKDAFGSSIALSDSGSIVAVGGSDNDGNGSNSGHVRVFRNSSAPSYTTIPDTNFEQYLIDQNIDSENILDGKILTADIEAIAALDIRSKAISDLTGIQDFAALTTLNATNNTITTLDVSENILLETLLISQNQLTEIDFSNNVNLKSANLGNNQFTALSLSENINLESLNFGTNSIATIDFSSNIKLKSLYLRNNSLENIDVSMLSDLTTLWCSNNALTSINTSSNLKLESLDCGSNQLSTLNVDDNIALKTLVCNSNQLTALNLSLNTNLTSLNCELNSIVYLDMSANVLLTKIVCHDNALIGLNMQNGNNSQVTNENFIAFANPNLFCVQVDENFSNNWAQIDMQTEFNTDCPELVFIPDANFEAHLESINVGNGTVGDFYVNKDLIEALTTLNIASKNITDVTGIENFTNLEDLNASNNNLTQIDVSKNTLLEIINLENNALTNIDFSKNFSLKNINIGDNQISTIDVYFLTELESLQCYKNQLSSINLISNKKLLAFVANENQLKTVDIRANTALVWIDVDDNLLTSLTIKNGNNSIITQFSATGNPNLTCIEVDNVSFSETNWTQKDATANFSRDCAPANDLCEDATPLTFGQITPGDINSGSFTNFTDCVAGTIIADVWYTLTVPETGELSIEGTGLGGLLKFALYDSCASNTAISCGLNISLTNLTPGTIYYLKVWMEESGSAKSNTESGTFTLTASESSVLSVDDFLSPENSFMVYPNPATNSVNLKSLNANLESVEIYNIQGKRVVEFINFKESNTIDVSKLSKGIYIIKAKAGNSIHSKKLLIK